MKQPHAAATPGPLGLLLAVSAMATGCGGPANITVIADGSQQDYQALLAIRQAKAIKLLEQQLERTEEFAGIRGPEGQTASSSNAIWPAG